MTQPKLHLTCIFEHIPRVSEVFLVAQSRSGFLALGADLAGSGTENPDLRSDDLQNDSYQIMVALLIT